MKRRMVLEKCLEKEEGSEKQKEVASFSSQIWVPTQLHLDVAAPRRIDTNASVH